MLCYYVPRFIIRKRTWPGRKKREKRKRRRGGEGKEKREGRIGKDGVGELGGRKGRKGKGGDQRILMHIRGSLQSDQRF